jgi:hypothetical protein
MSDTYPIVFAKLRELLEPHGEEHVIKADTDNEYTVLGAEPDDAGRDVWIASVQIKKSYVSFHLMPVYRFPDLLDELSPALEDRMQGKSCFNFRSVDERLFGELEELLERSVQRYRDEGLVS